MQVPAVESLKRAASELIAAPIAKQQQGPRETIMGLVKQHMPEVVRGDTNVTYAVIVLDATDNYVWGTYAVGLVQLVIGGDKRTPAERADYSFKHVGEYTGMTRDGLFLIENGEVTQPVQNFRWNETPVVGFNNISALGPSVPMHTGESYDNPGTALVPAMKIEDFTMTSISPAV